MESMLEFKMTTYKTKIANYSQESNFKHLPIEYV